MKSNLQIATIFILILSILITFFSIYLGSISWDGTYYLPIARDISEGKILYKDINSWYAPAMMYINALIYYFFGKINYFWFLGFQYFITFYASFILYKTAIFKKVDNKVALFLAVFLYISTLLSEGIYINLEVYVLFFVLLAFYLMLKKQFILSGIFVTLSMFSKQYGVLNFIPFLFYFVFFENKMFFKNSIKFAIGSLIPILIFIIYFVVINKVNLIQLLSQLSGEEYRELSVSKPFNLWYLIRDSKYILALIFPIFFIYKKEMLSKTNLIFIVGFLVNLLPIFFQSYPHYYILSYPFVFLFLIYNYKYFNDKYLIINSLCVLIAFCVVLFRINKCQDEYNIQVSKSIKYEKIYPKSSIVYLEGKARCLYILNDYKNPILKEEGYSDMFVPNEKFRQKYPTIKEN